MSALFKNIVGQEQSKRILGFYLDAYQKTRIMPHLMFVAPKGQGKTTLAQTVAKGLTEFDSDGQVIVEPSRKDPNVLKNKVKKIWCINCATIRTVKQFINDVIVTRVQDKDVTIIFDEASELPHPVAMTMLTMLNPNPNNTNILETEDFTCEIDFRRQTFMFATSEIHKVFHALVNRLERITLQDYSNEDLAHIVQRGLPEVECEGEALMDVATVLRGNARDAQKMATKINAYLAGRKSFGLGDWNEMKSILSIFPLGLNNLEIQTLRFLSENSLGTSLTSLAAKTGMSRDSLQKDVEMFLQRNNLMEIQSSGRHITAKGLEYLKSLEVQQKPDVRSWLATA